MTSNQKNLSLSDFLPADTEYFYYLPLGEESGFFNKDVAWRQELLAGRPLVCAGNRVKVIMFDTPLSAIPYQLRASFINNVIPEENIIRLPAPIDLEYNDAQRDRLIKSALATRGTEKKLLMAQPFMDAELQSKYQISPSISFWLNDKKNIPELIPSDHVPQRYAYFANGQELTQCAQRFPIPCVIKVTASGGGDGVSICKTRKDVERTKVEYAHVKSTILVEKFIRATHNIGVQFAIPHQPDQPIEIIGYSRQIISKTGEYLGAILDHHDTIGVLPQIFNLLLERVLPAIRTRGWYGIGGFDVLIDADNHFYFIDSNLRMTAMTTYLLDARNNPRDRPLFAFTGTFAGTPELFQKYVLPMAAIDSPKRKLYITSITKDATHYYFNAAIAFSSKYELLVTIRKMRSIGIRSEALSVLGRYVKEAAVENL